MAMSLTAGDAAASAGLASWIPPVSGFVLGLPVVIGDAAGANRLWLRIRGQVRVQGVQACGAGFVHFCGAALLVVAAASAGDPASYGSDSGGTTTAGFAFLAVLAGIVEAAILGAATAVYVFAFEAGMERKPREPDDRPDLVDEWVRRHPGRRTQR
jgi:hypothetical protein